jgi:hypothetical protein
MHIIADFAQPISSPLKTSSTKNLNQARIHVSACALSIARRVQINCNASTMGRRLGSGPLLTECEAAPEAGNLRLQPARLQLITPTQILPPCVDHAGWQVIRLTVLARSHARGMEKGSVTLARWSACQRGQVRRLAGCNRKCRQRFRRSPPARVVATSEWVLR